MSRENASERSTPQQINQIKSVSKLSNEVNRLANRVDRLIAALSTFRKQLIHLTSTEACELELNIGKQVNKYWGEINKSLSIDDVIISCRRTS